MPVPSLVRYEHVYPKRLWDLHKIIQELLRSNKLLPYVYRSVTFSGTCPMYILPLVLYGLRPLTSFDKDLDEDAGIPTITSQPHHMSLNFVTTLSSSSALPGLERGNRIIHALNRSSVDWTCGHNNRDIFLCGQSSHWLP